MKGFTEYGLILCPSIESYENGTKTNQRLLSESVNNIIAYLGTKEIKPLMLLTDMVATALDPKGVTWAQTISEADLQFAIDNCDFIAKKNAGQLTYEEFYEAAEAMVWDEDDIDDEVRFDNVNKRAALVEKALILRQDLIFHICSPSKTTYGWLQPVKDNPIILCKVHNGTFLPTTYIGDTMQNPIELLDYELANRPVYEWRFQ